MITWYFIIAVKHLLANCTIVCKTFWCNQVFCLINVNLLLIYEYWFIISCNNLFDPLNLGSETHSDYFYLQTSTCTIPNILIIINNKQQLTINYWLLCTIERLPDELLLKIFQYLSPSELLVCAQVCQQWTTITKERLDFMLQQKCHALN